MKVILTHPNADFDAVAAMLAAHKLDPESIPVLPARQNRNVSTFLMLYRSGLPFVFQSEFHPKHIQKITLVDTQRLPSITGTQKNMVLETIDHHQPYSRSDLKPRETFVSEEVGATTTLLVERIERQEIPLTALEATLLMLGIYEDTGSMSYGTTTARDIRAAAWLLEQQSALDTVRRFLAQPLNEEQQALFDDLMEHTETRLIQGHSITLSRTTIDEHVSEISSVVHRLRDILDSSALFVLVQMPESLLLVCRSSDDFLDVGSIAAQYGGGGHQRAAAATIHDQTLEEVYESLWEHIRGGLQPIARVADLMSYGVQALDVQQTAQEVAQHIRKIGHEGYPVLEDGRVVGLLTRRALDRTLEHGLETMTVREIMNAGEVTLQANDSVYKLEKTMVETGWGQIPVVDNHDNLVGIVTRTDLIKHWASTHPAQPSPQPVMSEAKLREILGAPVADLIACIAQEAQADKLNLYLVGGAVRDLLLNRANDDLDFVVESDAIRLAQRLQQQFGGELHSYAPFGTAKWLLDERTARSLKTSQADLPPHVDFATARNEFYEHPTALPTVYRSSIKLDLQRRDFTINTLTVQLSPAAVSGQILDFYGGMADLRAGRIRVLHSLSFVDDPTRIVRAFRFANRLGFQIEPRTQELIQSALPMLRRITGERVRNELTLLLEEDDPAPALLRMQDQRILQAIHPAFRISSDIPAQFDAAQRQNPPWDGESADKITRYWHVLAASIPASDVPGLCERLLIAKNQCDSMIATAWLTQQIIDLTPEMLPPSQIVAMLENVSETALRVAWLLSDAPRVRERIENYMSTWRFVHPVTTGHDLKALGLKPGPCYRRILSRLRSARLDGEISSDTDELNFRQTLIEQEAECL